LARSSGETLRLNKHGSQTAEYIDAAPSASEFPATISSIVTISNEDEGIKNLVFLSDSGEQLTIVPRTLFDTE